MSEQETPDPSNDEPSLAEPSFEERSISQVGTATRQNNVLIVIFGVAIVALLLWFVNRSEDAETATRLTQAAELEFDPPAREDAPELPVPQPALLPDTDSNSAQAADPFDLELRRLALRQAEEQQRLAEQRRRAPILVLDKRAAFGSRTSRAGPAPGAASFAGAVAASPGEASATGTTDDGFAAQLKATPVETVGAEYIRNKGQVIVQGALIRAVLETAIHSDLPGFVRAEVSHDVYAFDGSRILIPKGSRLVGRYRSALVRGQTRVFIIWSRLLRPDGASILIGSPGTDLLGRAGLEGELDTHFFKIFGASVLLSLIDGTIDVAIERARDSSGSGSTTILQDSNSLNRAAEIALENSINIPPTIHVDQGTPIQVFVAKDIDFRNVTPR